MSHAAFDRILVDAPCSNTGVMRRRVELRWRLRPEEIERLRTVQLDLLNQAAPLLKPGGVLVYSTCSLEPEENRQVVDEFLAGHAEFKLEHERKLLPFVDDVDGAYVARLTMQPEIRRPNEGRNRVFRLASISLPLSGFQFSVFQRFLFHALTPPLLSSISHLPSSISAA